MYIVSINGLTYRVLHIQIGSYHVEGNRYQIDANTMCYRDMTVPEYGIFRNGNTYDRIDMFYNGSEVIINPTKPVFDTVTDGEKFREELRKLEEKDIVEYVEYAHLMHEYVVVAPTISDVLSDLRLSAQDIQQLGKGIASLKENDSTDPEQHNPT